MTHAGPRPRQAGVSQRRPTGQDGAVTKDWQRLGEHVARRRHELGWTNVRAFALAVGVHENTLSKLERGGSVNRNTLMAIERTLRQPAGWCNAILTRSDEQSSLDVSSDEDLQLSDQIERDLWDNLKTINGLSHDERLAMLEMHRRYKRERGTTQSGDEGATNQ